jgi:hypothetical protein
VITAKLVEDGRSWSPNVYPSLETLAKSVFKHSGYFKRKLFLFYFILIFYYYFLIILIYW